jgi:hypothetical protein
MTRVAASRLPEQCAFYGVAIETICSAVGSKPRARKYGGEELDHPELAALAHYQEAAYTGSWCEGGTLKLLMKAAAFPVLVKWNYFHDRADARTRFFEAQCTLLKGHEAELLDRIATAPLGQIESAAAEILNEAFIQAAFPRVKLDLIIQLHKALGSELVAKIAQIFVTNPYAFRAGWPDLTLFKDGFVRFVEVKTTDLLRAEQTRIIQNFAQPLKLNFAVAHVVRKRGQI